MATLYFIENSDFGAFINFTGEGTGGVTTVPTTSQIEVEYLGKPATLALTSNVDEDLGSLLMWGVSQILYSQQKNKIGFSLAEKNVRAQRVLIGKLKNLGSTDFTVKQWDF